MRGEEKNEMGERHEEKGGGRGKEVKGKREGSTFSYKAPQTCSSAVPAL